MFKKNSVKALFLATLMISFCTCAVTKTDLDDSAITAAVKAKLLSDKVVSGLDIKVETNHGVVSLQGSVKTATEANKAVEIAISNKDVVDVDTSKLTISGSEHPIADAVITSKVRGMFIREKLFGNEPTNVTGIHIETTDGVVYLSGKTKSQAQIDNAIKLAKSVNGVKEVKSSLEIK